MLAHANLQKKAEEVDLVLAQLEACILVTHPGSILSIRKPLKDADNSYRHCFNRSMYFLAATEFLLVKENINMGKTNQSSVTEFVLLGLSGYPELEAIYFVLVLCMYLVILLGNGVIIIYFSFLFLMF
ncbi:olfactory receptor 13C3-like [Eptesicus fuscus]|uniref:olfactory receptor 13C3-like n=1 Tax=Eptesicus fuscus TaxID=29078 RepID=UPI00240475D9|nr:olfactory receptor 13C3-like [Eptesicus fuscus]